MTPDSLTLQAGQVGYFSASGGTGAYAWTAQIGSVAPSGIYVSEETGDDVVVLSDAGCTGTGTANVSVVSPLVVEPASVQLAPGQTFAPDVSGGSGSYSCSDGAGTALPGCVYAAAGAGPDVVVVTDELTGVAVETLVDVSVGAEIGTRVTAGWVVGVGLRFDPVLVGGSGHYGLDVEDPSVAMASFDADREVWYLSGVAPGATTVRVFDAHVDGLERTVAVKVSAHTGAIPPMGTVFRDDPRALSADLDGDGWLDVVVGVREASVLAQEGGSVRVYLGSADGPDVSTPAFVLDGDEDRAYLGKGLGLGDFDGDGVLDLVVGTPAADGFRNDTGRVTVHLGDGMGGFDVEPVVQVRGDEGGENLGNGVEICDVDGDGLADVVASSRSTDPATGIARSGAVSVYLQRASGGVDLVPIRRYGMRRVAGVWEQAADARLGEHGFAVGDIDHDGLCDVIAAADNRDWATDAGGDGFVLVYSGDASDGLSATPTTAIVGPEGGSPRFGRYLAVGDVDGSAGPAGLADDLLIGARGLQSDDGNNAGAAFVFLGGSASDVVDTDAADFRLRGLRNDLLGEGVAIGADGDVWVAVRSEVQAARIPANMVVSGGDFVIDAPPAGTTLFDVVEADGDDISRFGSALAPWEAGVVGMGLFTRELPGGGWQSVNAHALVSVAAGDTQVWQLGEPSGQDFGWAVALHDVDGDGAVDGVAGSPERNLGGIGSSAGGAFAFDGLRWGSIGESTSERGAGERRGIALGRGDVDGDGGPDLLIGAWGDTRVDEPALVACPDGEGRGGVGHVSVHLDRGDGVAEIPDFMWWPQSGRVENLAGGFDADGDGFQDVLVGLSSDDAVLVYGEDAPAVGDTIELCRTARFEGAQDFGAAVVGLSDLDGDGCDEVAIGAPREDGSAADRGVIRVLWGFGPACARSAPVFSAFEGPVNNARVGLSLSARDVDGDGLSELAVSGVDRVVSGSRLGDVFFVPGTTLADSVVDAAPFGSESLLSLGSLHWESEQPNAAFGRRVLLAEGPSGPYMAVSSPRWDQLSNLDAGGVAIYPITGGVPASVPAWWVAGDAKPDSDFGFSLAAAQDQLIIGAPGGSAVGLHTGSAVVVTP